MHLVEIFLPVTDGPAFGQEVEALSRTLAAKFGGVTAFTRSPGTGFWAEQGDLERDEIVVLEVMTNDLDQAWWRDLRERLEERLGQKAIVVRTHQIDRL